MTFVAFACISTLASTAPAYKFLCSGYTITGTNGPEMTGKIVLSRVNDVPGATPEQLLWRVRSFDIAR